MEGAFEKHPSVEILTDPFSPEYKIKYVECVNERGSIRFLRREKKVAREFVESLVAELLEKAERHGR